MNWLSSASKVLQQINDIVAPTVKDADEEMRQHWLAINRYYATKKGKVKKKRKKKKHSSK